MLCSCEVAHVVTHVDVIIAVSAAQERLGDEQDGVTLGLTRSQLECEKNKPPVKSKGSNKDQPSLGAAGFQRALQASSCTEAKAEDADATAKQIVTKKDGASKDVQFLLR